jgi:prepilin-type N-terminal cleavage/methylation domain-containing protein
MPANDAARRGQAGFTLIEALAAMVILTFGIMAVTNLLLIAGTSNTVAHRSTAATMAATRQMEILKSLTWGGAPPDGLTIPGVGVTQGDVDVDQAGFFADVRVSAPGVGVPVPDTPVHVRWQITGIDAWTISIRVRAEALDRVGATRTRAEFTTFRSCTTGVAPCAP